MAIMETMETETEALVLAMSQKANSVVRIVEPEAAYSFGDKHIVD